ncbi:hypothetical protein LSAT2_013879 [Lamellibrachia satsuma]|nr:hypothetical protein LSAT2_013879 [Lamellibrachia satsuma]
MPAVMKHVIMTPLLKKSDRPISNVSFISELLENEFQDHNDGLSAHWDISGDPCPIEKFEWAIHKFDGTVVLNMTQLPADAREAEADELSLKDGESYFVVLRVTNKLGFVYTVHSNGVTVKLEPLLPGNVRDGDIVGTDLNYQPSVTSLSANWDGFGKPKNDNSGPVISKVSHVDATIGEHLKIEHYEVAVGTDRRFHNTRNNIRPFTNVGLNVTWTFSDLELIARTSIYYVTVRAYSDSSSMVEVTSNGIKVGYGSHVVSAGSLDLSKYSSSATHLSFSWSGFKFLLPVKMYYWGMGTSEDALTSLSCDLLVHHEEDGSVVHNSSYTQLFDVHPLTSVNLDTYVQVTDLRLVQGKTYQVVIIAVDESGGCVETSDSVTVDTTPPLGSQIGVGPDNDMKLLYASSRDTLTAWWSGFTDPESGIKTFNIRLLSGESCVIHRVDNLTTLVDWTELSANSSSYDFTHLSLQESVVYFIDLQATNGADLELHNLSRPVLLDAASPIGGTVKHGDNFKEGATYQGSTTEIKGVFLYVPSILDECHLLRSDPLCAVNHRGTLLGQDRDNVTFIDDTHPRLTAHRGTLLGQDRDNVTFIDDTHPRLMAHRGTLLGQDRDNVTFIDDTHPRLTAHRGTLLGQDRDNVTFIDDTHPRLTAHRGTLLGQDRDNVTFIDDTHPRLMHIEEHSWDKTETMSPS